MVWWDSGLMVWLHCLPVVSVGALYVVLSVGRNITQTLQQQDCHVPESHAGVKIMFKKDLRSVSGVLGESLLDAKILLFIKIDQNELLPSMHYPILDKYCANTKLGHKLWTVNCVILVEGRVTGQCIKHCCAKAKLGHEQWTVTV